MTFTLVVLVLAVVLSYLAWRQLPAYRAAEKGEVGPPLSGTFFVQVILLILCTLYLAFVDSAWIYITIHDFLKESTMSWFTLLMITLAVISGLYLLITQVRKLLTSRAGKIKTPSLKFVMGSLFAISGLYFCVRWIFSGVTKLFGFLPTGVFTGYWTWSIWERFPQADRFPGVVTAVKWLVLLAIVGAIVAFFWALFSRDSEETEEEKKKRTLGAKFDQFLSQQTQSTWLWLPWVMVPEQYSVWIYWNFFGLGRVSRILDHTTWKIPGLQVAVLKNRGEVDIEIKTPQLPVRSTPSVKAGQVAGEHESEDTRLKLQAERGGSVIGATLSFIFPMTVGLRTGEGQRPLVKAAPAFSNISSDEIQKRFNNYVSTRLRDVLKRMRFEDAYMLDGRVFFIGKVEEAVGDDQINDRPAVGSERYSRLLESKEDAYTIQIPGQERINIFSINLADDAQVEAAVAKRPESLLATFWNFGYRVPFMKAEDPNATEEIQKALQDRVLAELQRDAAATRQLSTIVDKARAEIDARGAHARATRDNFRMVMSAMLEDPPKDTPEAERPNYIAKKLRELFTAKQLLDAQLFYEVWRRKVQVAENADQFTYIDAGGSDTANFMAAMAAGTSAGKNNDSPRDDSDKGRSSRNEKK